jgi:hypothetical protein
MPSDNLRETLGREIDVTTWSDLRDHATAERMLLVATHVDLLEVALATAEDRTGEIQAWITSGELARPSLEQMKAFEETQGLQFRCAIVQPFVLAQSLASEAPDPG